MDTVYRLDEGSHNFTVQGKICIDIRDGITRLFVPDGTVTEVLPAGPICTKKGEGEQSK